MKTSKPYAEAIALIAAAWSDLEDSPNRQGAHASLTKLREVFGMLGELPPAELPPPVVPVPVVRTGFKPVESDDEWWPDVPAAAEALGRCVSLVRMACNGNGYSNKAAGVTLRYSRYKTRAGWEMGRAIAASNVA